MARQTGPADRQALRSLLGAERERTLRQIAALEREFNSIVEAAADVATDDEHDPEGTTIAFERAQVAALADHARVRLADLEQALERLDAGVYGTCESCGRPIPPERLAARPTARTCVGCSAAGRVRR
jgi:RNA polymerase-binding transcription factor DksA